MQGKRQLNILVWLTMLSACAGGDTRFDLSTQAATGQLSYGAATLADAKDNFLGSGAGGGGDGLGGADGGGLLDGAADLSLNGKPPTVTSLTASYVQDVGEITLTSGIQVGYHQLKGTLPEGFDVLTDPVDIALKARSVSAQITAGQRMSTGSDLQLDLSAGLGILQIEADTRLQSALLDVRGSSRQTLPYAVAQVRLSGKEGLGFVGDVIVFSGRTVEARLGLAQAF